MAGSRGRTWRPIPWRLSWRPGGGTCRRSRCRARPSGLRRAVRRAIASALRTSSGTPACARCVAASASNSIASPSCRRSFRCSARMPERPGAPPLRAERRAEAMARTESCTGCAGWCLSASGATATRGSAGRRTGSVSAAHVASFPGASSEAVSTWRARDNSPCLTCAAFARRSRQEGGFGHPGLGCSHDAPPGAAGASRPAGTRLRGPAIQHAPCEPCWLLRASSIRGASKNSFHALAAPGMLMAHLPQCLYECTADGGPHERRGILQRRGWVAQFRLQIDAVQCQPCFGHGHSRWLRASWDHALVICCRAVGLLSWQGRSGLRSPPCSATTTRPSCGWACCVAERRAHVLRQHLSRGRDSCSPICLEEGGLGCCGDITLRVHALRHGLRQQERRNRESCQRLSFQFRGATALP